MLPMAVVRPYYGDVVYGRHIARNGPFCVAYVDPDTAAASDVIASSCAGYCVAAA